jgi:hypothetical protein
MQRWGLLLRCDQAFIEFQLSDRGRERLAWLKGDSRSF